ncbi:quinone-dependent dihydroorotate dehydrogenase [Crocinitomicaceae bacterium CZZ-1]|uniref:Dihydroorotate dehydrogenase (quinone) n=1 Tax=Taishania pollutisoli TaxID=2766479 RepID=A0A8J6PF90_9FLAO|nr:quinone-dependent dihydroorotate dehydrogenase [Taishania pollutisoli]MBC9813265.1 quinone-dependent dihydroorotate dehydrogenase [Taishania pollutisoli]
MYKLLRSVLFFFDAEKVHYFTTGMLRFVLSVPGGKLLFKQLYCVEDPRLKREVFGLTFNNPVGLAAGFDKNAKMYNDLAYCGFGFIEIGTLTPKGQPGNEKPRLFRLKQDEAIVNRMGFNNDGVEIAVEALKKRKTKLIIGGNIGKNKITPNEEADSDYLTAFHVLHPYVDYFVVNVSSPNTPNLRALQEKEPLMKLLQSLKDENTTKSVQKPILLKIAPDLTNEQLDDIIEIVQTTKIDGVIATNTTIERGNLKSPKELVEKIGAGGVSGKPLTNRSTEVIRYLSEKSGKSFPIIGVGGIHTPEDAREKLNAGAALIQIYTGFIYEGPGLVKRINKAILKEMN